MDIGRRRSIGLRAKSRRKSVVRSTPLLAGSVAPQALNPNGTRETKVVELVRPAGGKGEIGSIRLRRDGKVVFQPENFGRPARVIAKATKVRLASYSPSVKSRKMAQSSRRVLGSRPADKAWFIQDGEQLARVMRDRPY